MLIRRVWQSRILITLWSAVRLPRRSWGLWLVPCLYSFSVFFLFLFLFLFCFPKYSCVGIASQYLGNSFIFVPLNYCSVARMDTEYVFTHLIIVMTKIGVAAGSWGGVPCEDNKLRFSVCFPANSTLLKCTVLFSLFSLFFFKPNKRSLKRERITKKRRQFTNR